MISVKQITPLVIFMLSSFVTAEDFSWNMTQGVTPLSQEVYHLHMMIFYICVGIATCVFGIIFWSLIFHRKSLGHEPAKFHENIWLEIIWTIIPLLILGAMAWPATQVLIHFDDQSQPDLTIKIVGYQWFWEYDYPEYQISFFSNLISSDSQIQNKTPKGEHYLVEVDYPLVVPVGKKIRLLTTAADVQHAFWVPALGFKKDAIPGFINEAWAKIEKPGIYRGRCAELCGYKHGYMPIELHAVSQEDFEKFIQEAQKNA